MALTKVTGAGVEGLNLSSSSTAISIDANGHVTKPLQPAFSVHKNGTSQNNVSTNSHHTVVWAAELYDVNSDFDLSSETFTAPVTGKYQFNLCMRLGNLDSANAYYVSRIVTSNNTYSQIFDPDFGQDQAYWFVQLSVLADMDASDTAYATFYQNGGTAQTDIDGSQAYTNFTGFLAC
tara:strand:- start:47 stop:580 length:534 start_codon:yes stop_codon:yes gene_type:complete